MEAVSISNLRVLSASSQHAGSETTEYPILFRLLRPCRIETRQRLRRREPIAEIGAFHRRRNTGKSRDGHMDCVGVGWFRAPDLRREGAPALAGEHRHLGFGRAACGIQDLRGICRARFPVFTRDEPPGFPGGAANMGQDMIRPLALAPILALIVLAGCATGVRGSARNICYHQGFQPGTQEFTDCWHGERSRQFQGDAAGIAVGVGVVAAQHAPPAQPYAPLDKPQPPRQCIYWTPQGQRILQAVNGICPARYGQ